MTARIDPALIPPRPDLQFEQSLWLAGAKKVAGVDEAGRGCLAGPVAAAAVILPAADQILPALEGVKDSKALSAGVREELRGRIEQACLAWSVGFGTAKEIDLLGIVPATRLAMMRALAGLGQPPDHLLVDYLTLPDIPTPQTRLVKGDARCFSIAAASILAKTHRDAHLVQLAGRYPGYDLAANKGYGTAAHRAALETRGPCPEHRRSFAPLKDLISCTQAQKG